MTRRLVTVRADDRIGDITDVSMPIIRGFCRRWGAELLVLDGPCHVMADDGAPHFRILELGGLPDPFDEVPADAVGTVYEDVGNRTCNRQHRMRDIQCRFGDVGWDSGYINTGVFLVSSCHADLFTSINGNWYLSHGSDDVHLGYRIKQTGHKVHVLDRRWNHMTMHSEPPISELRFTAHIIHYAGVGVYSAAVCGKVEQMTLDRSLVWGDKLP